MKDRDFMNRPLLSIVIANYNYGRFLEDAIRSVIAQGVGDRVELIVCDGGSTDNSVDVIRKYEKYIAWWCSEKDGGQSAAFNKGFSRARGEFLTWLNADDILCQGIVRKLECAHRIYPECEWFACGSLWMDANKRILKCTRARPFSHYEASAGLLTVYSPSSFFSCDLLDRVGRVDERFSYMMDTELWLRFYHKGRCWYRILSGYAFALRLHPDAKMSGHNFSESPMHDYNHPSQVQKRVERQLLADMYPAKRVHILLRLSLKGVMLYVISYIETLFYKMKPVSVIAGE